jgi:hypothetical protein
MLSVPGRSTAFCPQFRAQCTEGANTGRVGNMAGLEIVVGYLIAWAVRKARRVGARLDDDVDLVLDTELDRMHDLVAEKLGLDPALQKLEVSAASGEEVGERTRRRVLDALADAVEADDQFAGALQELLSEMKVMPAVHIAAASGERSAPVGRDAGVKADHGSAAALTMGDVTIGASPEDPPEPGRICG